MHSALVQYMCTRAVTAHVPFCMYVRDMVIGK